MKLLWLAPLSFLLMAASPPPQLTLTMPSDGFGPAASTPRTASTPSRYELAPLPDRDIGSLPSSNGPAQASLAPTLYTSPEQFRGDGFSAHSTAQSEQERNLKPSVGFKLQVPLTPQ